MIPAWSARNLKDGQACVSDEFLRSKDVSGVGLATDVTKTRVSIRPKAVISFFVMSNVEPTIDCESNSLHGNHDEPVVAASRDKLRWHPKTVEVYGTWTPEFRTVGPTSYGRNFLNTDKHHHYPKKWDSMEILL